MQIRSLYKDYFQKSRMFLYPALDIKRGVSITPLETYTSWDNKYLTNNRMLICVYYLRDDIEFKIFEKTNLFNNKLFHSFEQIDLDKGVYIFSFENLSNEWDNFISGKYSQLSNEHKVKIKNFIGRNDSNLPYIESFLYPEKYYKLYAEMMNVKESLLREVGELCSLPDLHKETLNATVINLHFKEELS